MLTTTVGRNRVYRLIFATQVVNMGVILTTTVGRNRLIFATQVVNMGVILTAHKQLKWG